MLLNFAAGGAAINVLARQVGAARGGGGHGREAAGARRAPGAAAIRRARIGPGTANFTRGPAMTRAQAAARDRAPASRIAAELADDGVDPDRPRRDGHRQHHRRQRADRRLYRRCRRPRWSGRGTGVDDAGLRRKLARDRAGAGGQPARRGRPARRAGQAWAASRSPAWPAWCWARRPRRVPVVVRRLHRQRRGAGGRPAARPRRPAT